MGTSKVTISGNHNFTIKKKPFRIHNNYASEGFFNFPFFNTHRIQDIGHIGKKS